MHATGALTVVPPLPPNVYVRRPPTTLPFPLAEPTAAYFSLGRHALWQGVQAVGLRAGDAVLVPAYHHGAEIEALVSAGLTLEYYEGAPTLEPDEDELEALLHPGVRALYLIHYLGFPRDAAHWRAWCDERDLLLIEDAGHAWLARNGASPAGSFGDLATFCFYRTVGVPDGALLLVRGRAPGPDERAVRGVVPVAVNHASWMLQRSGRGVTSANGNGAGWPLGDPGAAASSASELLLPRLADNQVAVRRRTNYRLLLEELGERVRRPFDELPPGAAPYAFPLETASKERVLARLAEHGVAGLELWPKPHPTLPVERFPSARERRARTVALPVHQELRLRDVERIVSAAAPRRRRLPELRLEPIDVFEQVREQWDELAFASRNVFATWEWLSLWWRHFGGRNRLVLTACRGANGKIVAILPLYLAASRHVRVLRLLGHGTADQLGPICAPEDRLRAARALRRLLDDRLVAWDFFLGELLPGDDAWTTLLGARPLGRDGYPILRFEHQTWDEYAASRSRKFRKTLAQSARRLEDAHDVVYRRIDDPERLSDDLDAMFALHRKNWTDAQSPFGANERFHRELAEIAFRRGWLHTWLLELDGTPVAAEHTFRYAGTQNHYQGGRDPEWEHASVGTLLFTHAVRDALEEGVRECRFLRGREDYKYKFANADPELETVGAARTAVGRSALAATAAVRRRRDIGALRRWLR